METITKIGCVLPTIGEIPTSYVLALTYEEQLLYFLQKLDKELIPSLNQLIIDFSNYDKNFDEINEKIASFEIELGEFNSRVSEVEGNIASINEEINSLNNDIAMLTNKINNDISNLRNEIITIINDDYNQLKNYIDYQDSILNEKIDNIQIGQIQIYDPTSGTIKPLQEVINDLYGLTNKDGLTAGEFDALNLTATKFDAYQITAYEFDSAGKTILV